jgi:hypothetical protein
MVLRYNDTYKQLSNDGMYCEATLEGYCVTETIEIRDGSVYVVKASTSDGLYCPANYVMYDSTAKQLKQVSANSRCVAIIIV